jgi:hypothetical protein
MVTPAANAAAEAMSSAAVINLAGVSSMMKPSRYGAAWCDGPWRCSGEGIGDGRPGTRAQPAQPCPAVLLLPGRLALMASSGDDRARAALPVRRHYPSVL